MNNSEYSAEIKAELLEIVDAFSLGQFIGIIYIGTSKADGYLLTQFETSIGTYNHFYKIKDYENS